MRWLPVAWIPSLFPTGGSARANMLGNGAADLGRDDHHLKHGFGHLLNLCWYARLSRSAHPSVDSSSTVTISAPATMTTGSSAYVTVTMQNTGTTTGSLAGDLSLSARLQGSQGLRLTGKQLSGIVKKAIDGAQLERVQLSGPLNSSCHLFRHA